MQRMLVAQMTGSGHKPSVLRITQPSGAPTMNMHIADVAIDDTVARANVRRLAAAQALTGANAAVIFATGSIVGATLAPDISLATLPLSIFFSALPPAPCPPA